PRRRRCFIGEFLVPVQAHRTKFRFRASGCSESCHLPYAKRKPSEPFYFTREPRSSQREDSFFFRTGAAGMDWTSLQPLTTHNSPLTLSNQCAGNPNGFRLTKFSWLLLVPRSIHVW